jgi:hypothetical protein
MYEYKNISILVFCCRRCWLPNSPIFEPDSTSTYSTSDCLTMWNRFHCIRSVKCLLFLSGLQTNLRTTGTLLLLFPGMPSVWQNPKRKQPPNRGRKSPRVRGCMEALDKYENKYENFRVILGKFGGENKSGTCLLVASKINRGPFWACIRPYLCSTNAVLCKELFSA